MHFEVFVEDKSGGIGVNYVMEKIIGSPGRHKIRTYSGIGHLPSDLIKNTDRQTRMILNNLPSLLKGYGRIYGYPEGDEESSTNFSGAVIVVVDLDNKECLKFKEELLNVLDLCDPKPKTQFRIAVEEVEAWLLGDRDAVKFAYPDANEEALNSYEQDSICGTWEKLADAIYPGGAKQMKKTKYPAIGKTKCEWAEKIVRNQPLIN